MVILRGTWPRSERQPLYRNREGAVVVGRSRLQGAARPPPPAAPRPPTAPQGRAIFSPMVGDKVIGQEGARMVRASVCWCWAWANRSKHPGRGVEGAARAGMAVDPQEPQPTRTHTHTHTHTHPSLRAVAAAIGQASRNSKQDTSSSPSASAATCGAGDSGTRPPSPVSARVCAVRRARQAGEERRSSSRNHRHQWSERGAGSIWLQQQWYTRVVHQSGASPRTQPPGPRGSEGAAAADPGESRLLGPGT